MKILKKLAIGLLIVIALILVIGIFLPSNVSLERSVVMKSPPSIVFDQVNILKNWEQWSPWQKADTLIKVTYNEIPAGLGASYTWTSPNKNTGTGTLTISKVIPNELIVTTLDFKDRGVGESGYKFEQLPEGTKVTWYFKSDVGGNPFVKVMMAASKNMMGEMFTQGLNDIKNIVEKMPAETTAKSEIKIELTTVAETNYLAVHDTASVSTIGMKLGKSYGSIMEALAKQKLTQTNAPFAIYYTESTTNWEMDAGIPVNKPGKMDGNVKPGVLKAGNAVVAHYFGDYMGTSAAYDALKKYITTNNKKIIGAPWEVYVNDPMVEKDTAKWQTDVYFPIDK